MPDALALRQALDDCAPLQRLHQRLAAARARMTVIRPLLPAALASHLQAGPVDEREWVLIAGNAAVAAKLRQLVPRLEAALLKHGLQPCTIKIRVQSSHTSQ